MTQEEQRKAAKEFVNRWQGKGYEKGEKDKFWLDLLEHVFGIIPATEYIDFEKQVKIDGNTKFIDGYIADTKVLIEQKGSHVPLNKRGHSGTAFEQALSYANNLNYDEQPRWIVTSNFDELEVHDLKKRGNPPERIRVNDLEKDYTRLLFLIDTENEQIKKEERISVQAGEVVSKIYNALLKEYKDPTDEETLKSLNILCVRLVFCFYAEDAEIFPERSQFYYYLKPFENDPEEFREHLRKLFKVLDQDTTERDPYLNSKLAAFPYVNGGLFANESIEIPFFNEEIVKLILDASIEVDWSEISATIFGAAFESTLNPEQRRSGGMHYTSIKNIHKVIDPLFLDDLKEELKTIKEMSNRGNKRDNALQAYQDKLASLKFLDPACGSGNFLTETYISLRKLENDALKILLGNQVRAGMGGAFNPVKVSIDQFYGIEINDFAVSVAKTALWIAESQMLKETQEIIQSPLFFLPLSSYNNIYEDNALRVDWNNIISSSECSYIMGNPPFVGHQYRSKRQQEDMKIAFYDLKKHGKLDYVCAWYNKAADFMKETEIRTAFVSTNSIVQGESVPILWKFLKSKDIEIEFAYQTFEWANETPHSAHVHCVIICFKNFKDNKEKRIYSNDSYLTVQHINGYLNNGPDIFVEPRKTPLSKSQLPMTKGNSALDGGFLILSEYEKDQIIQNYPQLSPYIKRLIGSQELIKGKKRYCFWLLNAPIKILKHSLIQERLKKCKNFRLKSKRKGTFKSADTPSLFGEIRYKGIGDYLIIPRVSSENRNYIPIDFVQDGSIPLDTSTILPKADINTFGILTSNVHNAWMRTVAGRLKSDYLYSNTIVYNNFPWPEPTERQKALIEKTAQAILDARALYPNSSLADLYDPLLMPPELRKAHEMNDKAVMQAYGFKKGITEEECVAELFKLYDKKTKELES